MYHEVLVSLEFSTKLWHNCLLHYQLPSTQVDFQCSKWYCVTDGFWYNWATLEMYIVW